MSKLKVLYVGEDHSEFEMIGECLREAKGLPFEVTHADSLDSAVELLGGGNGSGYDAVLANLKLLESGGNDAYQQILECAPTTAVIVLEEEGKNHDPSPENQIGAEKILSIEALNPDTLAKTIIHAMEWKRTLVELKQVREELKVIQLQLIQSDKLAGLGRLASGVAHEVKNPLASLQMGVAFIKDNPTASEEHRNMAITEMSDAIDRANKIVNEMVDFSGATKLSLKPTDLNQLIQRSARLMHHEFTNKSTSVVKDLGEDLPLAHADADKIEQVLLNLFNNALHAMGSGGTIEVRTSLVDKVEDLYESGASFGTLEDGDHLEIQVRDHGTGIPEDKIGRVFEAFFTTKPKGEGTGLGLSVAGSILELHQGAIFLNNEKDPSGLRISLVLPVSKVTQ